MQDKFLGYGRQLIDDSDIQAVIAILKGESLTQGPTVDRFEADFCEYTGAKYAIAVSNGTAALHLAALALDLGPGDAVIVPALTFAATANAVLYTGATPVFADIEMQTLGLSAVSVDEAIRLAKKEGLRPRAIFPVHYAGRPCAMHDIYQIASTHRLSVVEDCCHALGARMKSDASGQWEHVGKGLSEFGIFSFHPVKHITTGEGGCLTTQDSGLAKKVAQLRSHGITKNSAEFINTDLSVVETSSGTKILNPWYHEMQMLGFNFRLCDIQAALGRAQLGKLDAFIAKRRSIAALYRSLFSEFSDIITLPPDDDAFSYHSYHLFPLQVDFDKVSRSRSEIMTALYQQRIGTQVHYLPVFWHPFYEHNKQLWRAVSCEKTFEFYSKALSIPIHPGLEDDDVRRVARSISDLLTEK